MLDEAMTRHHPDSPVCRLVYLLVLLDRPLWSVACVWADPVGGVRRRRANPLLRLSVANIPEVLDSSTLVAALAAGH